MLYEDCPLSVLGLAVALDAADAEAAREAVAAPGVIAAAAGGVFRVFFFFLLALDLPVEEDEVTAPDSGSETGMVGTPSISRSGA